MFIDVSPLNSIVQTKFKVMHLFCQLRKSSKSSRIFHTLMAGFPVDFLKVYSSQSDYEKTGVLLAAIEKGLAEDKEASHVPVCFADKPERYETVLIDILKERLAKDNILADELTQLLSGINLSLQVDQQVKAAGEIIGVESERMLGGRIKVTQKVEGVALDKQVTGAKLGSFGKPKK